MVMQPLPSHYEEGGGGIAHVGPPKGAEMAVSSTDLAGHAAPVEHLALVEEAGRGEADPAALAEGRHQPRQLVCHAHLWRGTSRAG